MEKTKRKKISVVISTLNAARTLEQCMEALRWTDEVLVIDNSSDTTPEICKKFPNCRYIKYSGPNPYINVKLNYGFKQAKGDWIMGLDCDQILNPEISEEIREIISQDYNEFDGYFAHDRMFLFGKFIQYTLGTKNNALRRILFKKGKMFYKCKQVHERPETTGRWGYLKNTFDHINSPTISVFLDKANHYTDNDMERITPEEARKKFRWYKLILVPFYVFFKLYIRNQGYRDGAHGFIVSVLMAMYNFIERAKLWEIIYKSSKKGNDKL